MTPFRKSNAKLRSRITLLSQFDKQAESHKSRDHDNQGMVNSRCTVLRPQTKVPFK